MRKYLSCMLLLTALLSQFSLAVKVEQETRLSETLAEIMAQPTAIESLSSNDSIVTLFTIHGSNTVGEKLAPALVEAYLKAKGISNIRVQPLETENEKVVKGDFVSEGKTVQVKIAAHGSSTGYKSLVNGEADIWASSRPAKSKEVTSAAEFADLTSSDAEHILGIDGLAIVVNPGNSIDRLSKAQLGRIFAGEISNWQEVGGADQPIRLFARDENSGTWDSFKNMVLGKQYALSTDALRFESSDQLVNNVVREAGGIGFIGMAFVANSKLIAISDGPAQAFKPSDMTVATEDYALSRRLFFYTDDQPKNKYVDDFMAFAQGINGQKIVKKEGFVSQNVMAMNMALPKDLPLDYLDMVRGAERLSINFRFQEGSAKLDNKALKDIQRLAYFLKKEAKGKRVMLIGFGDKRKNDQRSKLLSKLRAMAVRRELARLGIHPEATTGYGDFNPVASFEGASRVKNRRVEVWVR